MICEWCGEDHSILTEEQIDRCRESKRCVKGFRESDYDKREPETIKSMPSTLDRFIETGH